MTVRSSVLAALGGLFLVVPAACADLPPPEEGVCGNRVVDEVREDCDTYADDPNTFCRPPGAPGECRFACGFVGGEKFACPTGMGCGVDGTCRRSKGVFRGPSEPVAGDPVDVAVGDMDGDGRADVVLTEPSSLAVHYFDATATLLETFRTVRESVEPSLPLLAELSGDDRLDIVTAVGIGTVVDLGGEDRTLVPTAYPTARLPQNFGDVHVIPLRIFGNGAGLESLAIGSGAGASALIVLDAGDDGVGVSLQVVAFLPGGAKDLAGSVVVGDFDEDPDASPCDEVAFAFRKAKDVRVYSSCKLDDEGALTWNLKATPTLVALAEGGRVEAGPLGLDVNGDGHEDLVVGVSGAVQIAYGVGDGTFHSDAESLPAENGDNRFARYTLGGSRLPLAMADINADGVPDQVTPTEVRVSSVAGNGKATFVAQARNRGAPWTEALMGDFNGNGLLDIAAVSSEAPNLSFFNGTGDAIGTLNPSEIVTRGPLKHLTMGDLDGDLIQDIAVAEIATSGGGTASTLGDSVSVLFGRSDGAPEAPVGMGRLDNVQQIVSTLTKYEGIVDGIADLATVSLTAEGITALSGFPGRGDRLLRSPFGMLRTFGTNGFLGYFPSRFAVGQFAGSVHADLAGLAIENAAEATPPFRVWLIPAEGEARLDVTLAKDSDPLPKEIDWRRAVLVAVDLDGDKTDELVAFGPSAADVTKGLSLVLRSALPKESDAEDPMRLFAFGAPRATEGVCARDATEARETARASVVDLDGDDHPEVVTIATVAQAEGPPARQVVVLWNEGNGELGPMVALEGTQGVVDFAVVGTELAVATDAGAFSVRFTDRKSSQPELLIAATGLRVIAAGDVDGDGVPDLVLADGSGFVVHRGEAVLP